MGTIISNMDWGPLLGLLGTIITGLLAWVANAIKAKNMEAANKSKVETALLKLAAIATGMAGRAWSTLSPKVQAAMADGKLDAAERADIEAAVQELLKDFASADDLADIAAALGIPLPGLVAKIAAMLIEKFAFAHDPANPSVSKLEFPVKQAEIDESNYRAG